MTILVSSIGIENDNNIVLDFSSKMEDDDPEDSSYSATPVTARSDVSSASLLSKVIKVIIYTISRTNFESIILILKLTLYINIIVGG